LRRWNWAGSDQLNPSLKTRVHSGSRRPGGSDLRADNAARSAATVGSFMSHAWAINGPLRTASAGHPRCLPGTLRCLKSHVPGTRDATFQAGHATSTRVTCSATSGLVSGTLAADPLQRLGPCRRTPTYLVTAGGAAWDPGAGRGALAMGGGGRRAARHDLAASPSLPTDPDPPLLGGDDLSGSG
jgi:hypothetical protein